MKIELLKHLTKEDMENHQNQLMGCIISISLLLILHRLSSKKVRFILSVPKNDRNFWTKIRNFKKFSKMGQLLGRLMYVLNYL